MARTRGDEDSGGRNYGSIKNSPDPTEGMRRYNLPPQATMKRATAVTRPAPKPAARPKPAPSPVKTPVRAKGTAGAPGIQKKAPARPPGQVKKAASVVKRPTPPTGVRSPIPDPIITPAPPNFRTAPAGLASQTSAIRASRPTAPPIPGKKWQWTDGSWVQVDDISNRAQLSRRG